MLFRPGMPKFKAGSPVEWKWLGRPIQGTVEEVFLEPVVRTIKGKRIKRNGSLETPAYLVKSQANNLALKLETELSRRTRRQSAWRDTEEESSS